MALDTYRRKRNFRTTPEPKGRVGKRRAKELAFVIQKHAASRLHYDFRLELNGVLLSGRFPRGRASIRRTSGSPMHVEDHPIEYGGFEGIIPPKQYGAGTVLLWDRGTWIPIEDPVEGYRKGRLKFELDGEKLRGGWMLVRRRGARTGATRRGCSSRRTTSTHDPPRKASSQELPDSVASGRNLEDIADDADRVWQSANRSRRTCASARLRRAEAGRNSAGRCREARAAARESARGHRDAHPRSPKALQATGRRCPPWTMR